MNEFTKDELVEIYMYLTEGMDLSVSDPLIKKIDSMIFGFDNLQTIRDRTNNHGGCL